MFMNGLTNVAVPLITASARTNSSVHRQFAHCRRSDSPRHVVIDPVIAERARRSVERMVNLKS